MATPSHTLDGLAKQLVLSHKQSLITDLASAKGAVSESLGHIFKDHAYLSCHPMCGSEKTGSMALKLTFTSIKRSSSRLITKNQRFTLKNSLNFGKLWPVAVSS